MLSIFTAVQTQLHCHLLKEVFEHKISNLGYWTSELHCLCLTIMLWLLSEEALRMSAITSDLLFSGFWMIFFHKHKHCNVVGSKEQQVYQNQKTTNI